MYVCFLNSSSSLQIAEPLTSELIDTPVFHNLAPRPIKYRVSVPIPNFNAAKFSIKLFYFIYLTVSFVSQRNKYEIVTETQPFNNT